MAVAALAGVPQYQDVPRVADDAGEAIKGVFLSFLEEFSSKQMDAGGEASSYSGQPPKDYELQAADMKEEDRTTMMVDYRHFTHYDQTCADAVVQQYYRFEPFLRKAVNEFMQAKHPEYANDEEGRKRMFYVGFHSLEVHAGVRDLKTGKLGTLMAITGTVTRSTEVRPELVSASFTCAECSARVDHIEQEFKYTEPGVCKNATCNNRERWLLDRHNSVFVDWQRVRVQENAGEIPAGSMPRSTEVILRNEIVEKAKPGDKVIFVGTPIVVPDVSQMSRAAGAESVRATKGRAREDYEGSRGLKAMGVRDLSYRLSFLACSVAPVHTSFGSLDPREGATEEDRAQQVLDQFTSEERARIVEMKETPNLYDRMVNSVAPAVFGHTEIKRGILLMLFGGVHKETGDKASLRGDINVCIVGDPSTSKSQFLKYVVSFLPRAVYTSGKASSAAGLTASVVKDPETGEFTVEAGALMLADNSVCCIDEFDKMDIRDQTAIHEAMEQQTISIAKAGIQATLNARTSILAAANPIYGRYDKTRNLKQNVDISAPIMSRFDLFYVVLDEGDELVDYNIARHIVNLHQSQEVVAPEFSTQDLQTYIRFARAIDPQITPEARRVFVDNYKQLRIADMTGTHNTAYRITVRQLESMIRLAEALARLHLDEQVKPVYVEEAARLLKMSIIHVDSQPITLDDEADVGVAPMDEDGDDGDDGDDGHDGDGGDDAEDFGGSPRLASWKKKHQGKRLKKKNATETTPTKSDTKQPDDAKATTTPGEQPVKKLTITFQEYQTVARLLVHHLREHELRHPETPTMTQAKLIEGYLKIREESGNLQSEDALVLEHRKVTAIIRRLVNTDYVLLVDRQETANEDERTLSVHPNYDPENDVAQQRARKSDEEVKRRAAEAEAAAEEQALEEEAEQMKQAAVEEEEVAEATATLPDST